MTSCSSSAVRRISAQSSRRGPGRPTRRRRVRRRPRQRRSRRGEAGRGEVDRELGGPDHAQPHPFVGDSQHRHRRDPPVFELENVLNHADLAMYQAKAAGRNQVMVYEDGLHTRMVRRLELEANWSTPSSATSSSFTTSQSSTWGPGPSSGWKRWCAGAIPRGACSPRPNSWALARS